MEGGWAVASDWPQRIALPCGPLPASRLEVRPIELVQRCLHFPAEIYYMLHIVFLSPSVRCGNLHWKARLYVVMFSARYGV